MKRDWITLLISGLGLALIQPPLSFWFLAPFVWVPFLIYIQSRNLYDSLKAGYVLGLIWNGGTLYWIGWATLPGLLGALLWLPVFTALFSGIFTLVRKRWGNIAFLAVPFLWTGIEIINSMGAMAFPWNKLAYSFSRIPAMIQFASWTGAYGVTFWIMILNVLIYSAVRNHGKAGRRNISIFIVLCILPLLHGLLTMNDRFEEEQLRISLVQGNIDPYKKWTPEFIDTSFSVYHRLTNQGATQNPDFIVWPETATPAYIRHKYSYLRRIKTQIDSINIPLITGAPDYDWDEEGNFHTYNGALLIRPNSMKIERYNKIRLVPFSEKVPFVEQLPFLYNILDRIHPDIGDFTSGDSICVFHAHSATLKREVAFSIAICFESIFPGLIRQSIERGAEFLLIITNDGWFGNTSGPYQHHEIAVLRAIENRRSIARCANTGISSIIDPWGRVTMRSKLNEEIVLTGFVPVNNERSFYTRYGIWIERFFLSINGLIITMLCIQSFGLKKRKTRSMKADNGNEKR